MPKISIVVPARDVTDYVGDLLGDLRLQRFTDLEVLLVDDRSQDGTRDLLERTATEDRRFRLLEGAGTGPSDARNLALEQATGELLAFVDADDRLSPDYLATLHSAMQASGSDVVVGNVRRLHGGRTRASRLHLRACARPGNGLTLGARPELVYDVTVWNKLIRRELWEEDGLRFVPGRWINDNHPSLRTHVLAHRVDILGEVVYYWRERARGDSITASKFRDATSLSKSLADRAHAITTTRAMLADADVPDVVRARFDERLLLHDLWTYLPLHPVGDRHYRRQLESVVADVLAGLSTAPDDHPLGPLLQTVYAAVREGDRVAVAQLLAADTLVEAVPREGAIGYRLTPGRPSQARLVRLRSRLAPSARTSEGPSEHLTFEARINGVRLVANRPARLRVTGHLRIRDGASDLDGPWLATVWLTANGTRTGTRRASSDLAPLPAPDAHPLRRPGWRAFAVELALDELSGHPELERWTLQVGAQLDRVHHRALRSVAAYVEPTLAVGIRLDEHLDIVPRLDRKGQVQLRLSDARVRVAGAGADGTGGGIILQLTAGSDATSLWWQDLDGRVLATAPVDQEGRARLPLTPGGGTTHQLWAAGRCGTVRPRTTTDLPTVVVAEGATWERVLRPTLGGSLILEERAPRLTLIRAWAGDELLHLAGPPPARGLEHVDGLVLESVWSDAEVAVPISREPDRWHAALPLATLAAGSTGFDTAWTWRLLASDLQGEIVPMRTATEARSGLPFHAVTQAAEVELRLGARGTPRLLVGATPAPAPAAASRAAG